VTVGMPWSATTIRQHSAIKRHSCASKPPSAMTGLEATADIAQRWALNDGISLGRLVQPYPAGIPT
jgi:hypothetical protein